MKNKKTILTTIAIVGSLVILAGVSLAFFSDKADIHEEATAGTLTADVSIPSGKVDTAPNSTNNFTVHVNNKGNKSADTKIKLEIQCFQENGQEIGFTNLDASPVAVYADLLNEEDSFKFYNDPETGKLYAEYIAVLDGDHELDEFENENVGRDNFAVPFKFKVGDTALFNVDSVVVTTTVYGKQHRNTNTGWEVVETIN